MITDYGRKALNTGAKIATPSCDCQTHIENWYYNDVYIRSIQNNPTRHDMTGILLATRTRPA